MIRREKEVSQSYGSRVTAHGSRDMWVYLNDRLVEQEHALVSVFDHGFLYGDGVFETLRVYNKRLLFLDRHLARLRQSCDLIKLPLPAPEPDWPFLLEELIERNNLQHSMIRVTISRGIGHQGPDPTACRQPTVVIFPRPIPQFTAAQRERGVDLVIVKTRRHSALTLPPHIKSLNYLNNILAKQEALQAQAFDGVMLNIDGYLAEGTSSNIFFVKDKTLHTPSLECGILPGITREVVMNLAKAEGIDVEEGAYGPEELTQADECFLSNTGFGVLPVCTIGISQFQSGNPGSLTRKLQGRYEQHVTEREE